MKKNAPLQFQGFSRETLKFLSEVHRRNSKPWFEEHRGDYERVLLGPMKALAMDLAPVILQIDPEIDTRPYRVVSRIHRDTRFSKNKSLYKKSMWLTFKRLTETWHDRPAYYFELFPEGYRYGMGFYLVSKETMDKIRETIKEKPALVRERLQTIKKLEGMHIEGQAYKRVLDPAVGEEFRELYQKKELYFVANREIDKRIFGPAIAEDLIECFGKMASLYYFFDEVRRRPS
jgi:uncharacterized protein (TIGR02453 family)